MQTCASLTPRRALAAPVVSSLALVLAVAGCYRHPPPVDGGPRDAGPPVADRDAGLDAGSDTDASELADAHVEVCEADTDCAAIACSDASCVDGACVRTLQPDDTACDDDDLCTRGDRCVAGACAGERLECAVCAGSEGAFVTTFVAQWSKQPAALIAREGGGWAMTGFGDGDLWLGAIDDGGEIAIDRGFGSAMRGDRGFAIARAHDGSLVLGGYSQVEGPALAWTARVGADDGEAIERRAYFDDRNGSVHGIVPLGDGGAAMAGVLGGQVTLFRTAADGSITWERGLFEAGWAYGVAGLVLLPGGGLAVAGDVGAHPSTHARVVRTDADGRTTWDRDLGGSTYDTLHAIVALGDGGVIVGGATRSVPGGSAWVVRLDAAGEIVWSRTYGDDSNASIEDVAPTGDGGFLLASGAGGDAWLLRIDGEGTLVEEVTLDLGGYESATVVREAPDGGVVLGGWSDVPGDETPTHAWIVRGAELAALACAGE